MQNNIKRGIFVFLLSTLCFMLLHINVYGLPNEVPEFPHPQIKGQLVSKSKKNSTAFKNLGITIYGNNVQISRLYVKTDSDGHFCLPLQNASGDINVIISMPDIKEKDANKYYVTTEPTQRKVKQLTDTLFNVFVHYNIDAIVDSLYDRGEKIPFFLDWLYKVDKNIQGDYSMLEPPPYNKDIKEKYGPYYKSKPIVWILDGWYWTRTGDTNHTVKYQRKQYPVYDREDRRYSQHNGDANLLLKLDEVQDVYISTDTGAWKPWFIYDNLELMNPATIVVFLHSESIKVKNKIRHLRMRLK